MLSDLQLSNLQSWNTIANLATKLTSYKRLFRETSSLGSCRSPGVWKMLSWCYSIGFLISWLLGSWWVDTKTQHALSEHFDRLCNEWTPLPSIIRGRDVGVRTLAGIIYAVGQNNVAWRCGKVSMAGMKMAEVSPLKYSI